MTLSTGAPVSSLDFIGVMLEPSSELRDCVAAWTSSGVLYPSLAPLYPGSLKKGTSYKSSSGFLVWPGTDKTRDGHSFDELVRFEFNPQRASFMSYDLLSNATVHHITRADVAIDYHGLNISSLSVTKPRVKSAVHRGPGVGGAIETVYLGSPASARFIRVYDKAKELGIRGEVTRFEAVTRQQDMIPENLFENMVVTSDGVGDLKFHDAALVAFAREHPERLSEVHKSVRRRVLGLLEGLEADGGVDVQSAYLRDRGRLLDDLNGILYGGRVITPIDLYCDNLRNAPPDKQNRRTKVRRPLRSEIAVS